MPFGRPLDADLTPLDGPRATPRGSRRPQSAPSDRSRAVLQCPYSCVPPGRYYNTGRGRGKGRSIFSFDFRGLVVRVVALEEDGLQVGCPPGNWRAATRGELDGRPGKGAAVGEDHPDGLRVARLRDPTESSNMEPDEANWLPHLRRAPFPVSALHDVPLDALIQIILYSVTKGKDGKEAFSFPGEVFSGI